MVNKKRCEEGGFDVFEFQGLSRKYLTGNKKIPAIYRLYDKKFG